jgi:DNA repair exonuclease SbcCD ATPase subunit
MQLSTLKDRLTVSEKGNSDLASDLATAQQQLNDVHKSWQEQVSELSLKQIEIDGLNRQVQELQNQSQNDTESLLEERNEKKLATDRIHQLQTDYKELDVSRSRPIDGANKSSAQTSVKKSR